MREQKTVFNKLFKADLASQRVELSLIEDFNKAYQKLNDDFSKAELKVVDYDDLGKKIIAEMDKAGNDALKISKMYQDIVKMSKDLGIEIPANVNNQGQVLELYFKDIDYYIGKIKSNKVGIRNG